MSLLAIGAAILRRGIFEKSSIVIEEENYSLVTYNDKSAVFAAGLSGILAVSAIWVAVRAGQR